MTINTSMSNHLILVHAPCYGEAFPKIPPITEFRKTSLCKKCSKTGNYKNLKENKIQLSVNMKQNTI